MRQLSVRVAENKSISFAIAWDSYLGRGRVLFEGSDLCSFNRSPANPNYYVVENIPFLRYTHFKTQLELGRHLVLIKLAQRFYNLVDSNASVQIPGIVSEN